MVILVCCSDPLKLLCLGVIMSKLLEIELDIK